MLVLLPVRISDDSRLLRRGTSLLYLYFHRVRAGRRSVRTVSVTERGQMNSKRVAYKDACILQGVLTLANIHILTQLLVGDLQNGGR